MAQHDYDLANAAGAGFRADANLALAAIVSNNSGATEPATMFAYMFWADTTTGLLKIRNAGNTAWITIGTLAAANLGLLSLAGGTMTGALTMNNAVNEARATVVGHATTSPIWAAAANSINLTGAPTYTTFPAAPQAGAKRRLYPEVGAIFTHGGAFDIVGNANFTAAANDIVDVEAITTTTFRLIPIRDSGQPVVTTPQTSEPYIYIRDEKPSATDAGDFTSGAWRTRELNTEVRDASGLATLATNQITLAAGTYRFKARAPGYNVGAHQARLQNVTDTISYYGSTAYLGTVVAQSDSFVTDRFTIATTKVFELQHQCSSTKAGNGFGTSAGFGNVNVNAEIEFWKEF